MGAQGIIMAKKKLTATEAWIETLRKAQEAKIASGQVFDGQERDNILSFNRRKAPESPWDFAPSECNF